MVQAAFFLVAWRTVSANEHVCERLSSNTHQPGTPPACTARLAQRVCSPPYGPLHASHCTPRTARFARHASSTIPTAAHAHQSCV
eukprot:7352725-Prymnesium_polylepis.1